MHRAVFTLSVVIAIGTPALLAQNPMSTEAKTAYEGVRTNILKAAEKMPDADFAFKPTPDVRSFGQLIAHVADAQTGICGIVNGEMKRGDAASKTTKADLIVALKASNNLCDAVYTSMSDAEGAATVKAPAGTRSRIGMLNFNVAHDNEMYGTMSVYLRLKGLVPPSTEGAAARGK
jgi:uncharacterized damage-inducible protein DinB